MYHTFLGHPQYVNWAGRATVCCNGVKQRCSGEVIQHCWREKWTDRCCKTGLHHLLWTFPPFCEDKTTIWRGVRQSYYPFLLSPCWKCQFEVVLWKRTSSSLTVVPTSAVWEKPGDKFMMLCLPPHPHRTLSAVRPFLFLQGPSQSQAQFIQQRRARRGCGQLQHARRRDLLLISMQLHAAAFHTSRLTVTIIPTEDE